LQQEIKGAIIVGLQNIPESYKTELLKFSAELKSYLSRKNSIQEVQV